MVLVAVLGGAGVLASTASAAPAPAPAPARFAVAFSATLTSTVIANRCAPAGLLLNAAITSVAPITATLTGTKLAFKPDLTLSNDNRYLLFQQLQATVSVSQVDCPGLTTAKTCGPSTAMIKPGLKQLDVTAGKLTARFQSGYKFFPDAGCSTGLIEMGSAYPDSTTGSTPFIPADLLKKNVTTVTGVWTHDLTLPGAGGDASAAEHTVVNFTVRFTRLP